MKMPDRSRLFDAVFDEGEFTAVTADIAAAIGARSFLGGFAFDDGSRQASVSSDYWTTEQVADYYANWFHLDPWNQVVLNDWQPFRAREFSSAVRPAQVERSALYQDFIRPMGDNTFHVAGIFTDTVFGRGSTGFQRGRDQPDFSEEEVRLLDSVAPDYARVLALRGHLTGMERAILDRSSVLDGLHDAIIMLGTDARIVTANRAAEALLARGDVLRQRGGRLVAATPAGERVLADKLARTGAAGLTGLRLTGANGCALDLSLLALPAAAGPARVMVSIGGAPPAGRATLLREIYGLSASEAIVALLLADGLDPADIAETRGVSRHTVRVQLRAIAEKMECRRQIDIVRRIAALPRLSGQIAAG